MILADTPTQLAIAADYFTKVSTQYRLSTAEIFYKKIPQAKIKIKKKLCNFLEYLIKAARSRV